MRLARTPDFSTALCKENMERPFKAYCLRNFMSGPGEGKIKLGKADVYLHLKGKSGASVTHIDIELEELNKIIKPKESSFVGGKKGGVFLGLRKEMVSRAEKIAKKK
jgi:hypothetical protein